MKGIFGIFIGFALLAGSGLPGWCATPDFVDSLRTELGRRIMPERLLFLPLALADQRFDEGREGIWSLTALDAIRGKARLSVTSTNSVTSTGSVTGKEATGSDTGVRSDGRSVALTGSVTEPVEVTESADRAESPVTEPVEVTGGGLPDSLDVRFDERIATRIALDRLQELFGEFGDWDEAIVAYAVSPTALAAMDSTSFANAPILKSLRRAEEEYSENIPAAFERIGSLAERRKAEHQAFLREQAALRQARLDSIRKRQAERTDRISYTIKRGDTLGGIAARYRVKVSDLKRWNNLRSDMIREGRKLVIYR